jgi:hypothetical protein
VARPLIGILDWVSVQLFWEKITFHGFGKNWLSGFRVIFFTESAYPAKLIILVSMVFVLALDGRTLLIFGLTVFNSAILF